MMTRKLRIEARVKARVKGRPLRAAGVFFAIWIAARLVLWESPFVQVVAAMPVAHSGALPFAQPPAHAAPPLRQKHLVTRGALVSPPPGLRQAAGMASGPGPVQGNWPLQSSAGSGGTVAGLLETAAGQTASAAPAPADSTFAASSPSATGNTAPGLASLSARPASRWSGDAWLLWREALGPVRAQQGFVAPAYGARQVGAVLRYRLAPGSPQQAALYLRGTRALERANESEIALGLSLRPLRAVPLVVGAELRGGDVAGAVKLRPAVLAVTQLPAADLPLRLRADAYVQGGYVGGPFATAFADGQLRLTRRLIGLGGTELRAGGGTWGGVQRGAARLDVGPTADVALPLGPVTTRLSADWRFRVAGDAIPGSGPAITLSAGF